MKLSVLVDNYTLIDRYYFAEPGLSLFVEHAGIRVLFDTGYSDAFLRNAETLKLDPTTADFLVFSHGHIDHTWGLDPFIRVFTEQVTEGRANRDITLVAHPDVFLSKTKGRVQEIGSLVSEDKAARHFTLELTAESRKLAPGFFYLGEIPRENDFESVDAMGRTVVRDGEAKPDMLIDDTALACVTSEGLFVITGCAHAGVVNTIEHARKVTGMDNVCGVLGGFHLLKPSQERLSKTAAYLKTLDLKYFYPCHCTDLGSKLALAAAAPIGEAGSGLVLEVN